MQGWRGIHPPDNGVHRRCYRAGHGFEESALAELVAVLDWRLADAVDLDSHVRRFHWNPDEPGFIAMHGLFRKISEDVASYVDILAERVAQLGGAASPLEGYPVSIADGAARVEAVSGALADVGRRIR